MWCCIVNNDNLTAVLQTTQCKKPVAILLVTPPGYLCGLQTVFGRWRATVHIHVSSCKGPFAPNYNDVFFLSSCVNSYIRDNATHPWWPDYNVNNLCRCRQVRTGPKKISLMHLQSSLTRHSKLHVEVRISPPSVTLNEPPKWISSLLDIFHYERT